MAVHQGDLLAGHQRAKTNSPNGPNGPGSSLATFGVVPAAITAWRQAINRDVPERRNGITEWREWWASASNQRARPVARPRGRAGTSRRRFGRRCSSWSDCPLPGRHLQLFSAPGSLFPPWWCRRLAGWQQQWICPNSTGDTEAIDESIGCGWIDDPACPSHEGCRLHARPGSGSPLLAWCDLQQADESRDLFAWVPHELDPQGP